MATAREAQQALKRSPIYRFSDREVDTRLRQIAGDDGDRQAVIRTVQRRGESSPRGERNYA